MRTLDSLLTAAPKKNSRRQAVKLIITIGATTYTYLDSDRVRYIKAPEGPLSQKAEIVLDNHDLDLYDLDFKGRAAVIYWGYVCDGGPVYEAGVPYTVLDQRFDSQPGIQYCTLDLAGLPDMMAEDKASAAYLPDDTDTKTIKTLFREVAGDTGVTIISVYNHCASVDVVFDSEDGLIDTFVPKSSFRIYEGGRRLAALNRLLSFTGCMMRFEADGKIHVFTPVTTGATYDYEYSLARGQHGFFSKAYQSSLVIPNHVTIRSQADDEVQYSGTATSAASYALKPIQAFIRLFLASDAQAEDIAEAAIQRYEMQAQLGSATLESMNCGAEVFDYVKVTDAWAGDERTGNIGGLTRYYKNWPTKDPEYYMVFSFGWMTANALWRELEVDDSAIGGGGMSLSRLVVKDLAAENITADNILLLTMDELDDGDTYKRVLATQISAGKILLSDQVEYNAGYNPSQKSRTFTTTPTTPYDVGDIWLDASNTKRCTTARATGAYVAGDWTATTLDTISDGSSYSRVLSTVISSGYINLSSLCSLSGQSIDSIADGTTYARVKSTQISAGEISLSGGIQVSEDHVRTSSTSTRLDLSSSGIQGYNSGVLQCEIKATDGSFYAGAGNVKINSTGVNIYGDYLSLYYSTTKKGSLRGISSGFEAYCSSGDFYMGTGGGDFRFSGGEIICSSSAVPRPSSAGGTNLGTSTYYWGGVYADVYYGNTGTIQSFDTHDDIALVRALKAKPKKDEHGQPVKDVEGKPVELLDFDSVPPQLKDPTGKMLNMGSFASLGLGAVRQLHDQVLTLENRIAALEGRGSP